MSTRGIARRYARALFELESEGAKLSAGLKTLAEVARVKAVHDVLVDPQLPAEVQAAVLIKAAGKLPKELVRLVNMLCARGKGCLLPEIHELFEVMQREASAKVVAEVTAAVKLNTAVQDKLAKALAKALGKKVELKVSQDAGILGGVIIRIGDRQIDYSLRGRLEGLRRAIAA